MGVGNFVWGSVDYPIVAKGEGNNSFCWSSYYNPRTRHGKESWTCLYFVEEYLLWQGMDTSMGVTRFF